MSNQDSLNIRDNKTMKAFICNGYGSPDVLQLEDVDIPTVADDEVLVKVKAASINPYDRYLMRGEPYLARIRFGLFSPKARGLGQDFSGVIEEVGPNVTEFRVGDEVFGDVAQLFADVDRAFAEFVCVSPDSLVIKPKRLSFEQAAAVPMAARTALLAVRNHKKMRPGLKILINGASGGVGTFAVQIAKSFGAEVTAVCSTKNQEIARSLGADQVIDYTQQDFIQLDSRFDLILDVVSSRPISECRRLLSADGVYVWVGASHVGPWFGPLLPFIKMWWLSMFVKPKNMVQAITPLLKEDLVFLNELLETEKITPVIDKAYQFNELPEAIRYLEEGHAQGKIVISM